MAARTSSTERMGPNPCPCPCPGDSLSSGEKSAPDLAIGLLQLLSLDQGGEDRAELATDVVPVDSQLHRGPDVVQLLSDVVADAFEDVCVHGLPLSQQANRI